MATAKKTVEQTVEQTVAKVEEINGKNPVIKVARTMLLAGFGTVAIGKEEIEAMIERLVKKGEAVEKDGRKRLEGMFERRRKDVSKAEDKVEGLLDHRVESVLNAMNIPSKNDLDSLSRKIGSLTKKVSDLDKKLVEEEKVA